MWIFAKGIGFLSIVQDLDSADMMCVRARKREHLVNALREVCDESEIIETPDGDYRWRISCYRDIVMQLLADCVEDIDYTTNVKGTISAGDHELSHAMMTCWGAMARYQDANSGDHEDFDWETPLTREEEADLAAGNPIRLGRAVAKAASAMLEDDFPE